MKTQSKTSRSISLFLAILFALFLTAACGNIAGANFQSPAPAAQTSVQPKLSGIQSQNNTITTHPSATTYSEPDIYVTKPN